MSFKDVVAGSTTEKWGRILVPIDVNPDASNFAFGKLCILTAKKEILNVSKIEVRWKDVKFDVCIQEDGDWCPPFCTWKQLSEDEQLDSDDGISDTWEFNNQNEEDLFDTNSDEESEVEIRSKFKDKESFVVHHNDEEAHDNEHREMDSQEFREAGFSAFDKGDNNESGNSKDKVNDQDNCKFTQSNADWASSDNGSNERRQHKPNSDEPSILLGQTLPDLNIGVGSVQLSNGNSNNSCSESLLRRRKLTSLKLKDIIGKSVRNSKKDRRDKSKKRDNVRKDAGGPIASTSESDSLGSSSMEEPETGGKLIG
ncbi:hypothetical protein L2E82_41668 [Cichorium intybus]|uniref:Uncharacterized protein n=1 Tax=Cichorium intybus TaxID=13427 RepID=A0ACB8ZJW5_CICIN|nr:hypothetical protein L2E82_41668 [Cichorium intybus]